MKKILVYLFLVVIVCSCTMKEKMIINDDNSGTFSYGFDLSGIFKVGFKSSDSTKTNKVVDSTFTFKEVFAKAKDSIAKLPETEKQKLKLLENFKVHVQSNELKQQLKLDVEYNFPSMDSLKNMVSPLEALEAMPKIGPGKQLGSSLNAVPEEQNKKTHFSYNYDGKVFEKKILIPEGAIKSTKKKKKVKTSEDGFSKKMDEILKNCKYSFEYHFPKRIKTVSIKNAVIAKDRKSFVLDIPVEDLPENEQEFGFKVVFEN